MAPPPDSDAQFKFLIACIKYSTAGKVNDHQDGPSASPFPTTNQKSFQIDFGEVAKECTIVSKGAA